MFTETAELTAFRDGYRTWLSGHVPPDWRSRAARSHAGAIEVQREWMRQLHAGGWSAPTWPREYGGLGASVGEQIVIFQENKRADAPPTRLFNIAVVHAGSTLILHGTDEQKRHLPNILRGDEIWCQGFSEPDAGSDLASLTTRAVRDGDHYVVTGQKLWSSGANHADWCLLLARTDPLAPKHKGISYFIVDMGSPGIEVRPLRKLVDTGGEFCEIFLTDVAVPAGNLVGVENDGWRISQTTLSNERGPFVLAHTERFRDTFRRLAQLAEAPGVRGVPWREDPEARAILARDYADVEILAELCARLIENESRYGKAGAESSIIKLYYSELGQRLARHGVWLSPPGTQIEPDRSDDPASDDFDGWMASYLSSRSLTIAGGTSEIQRNLIGERILGLPREPRQSEST